MKSPTVFVLLLLLSSSCASSSVNYEPESYPFTWDVYLRNLKGDYENWDDHKALAFAVDSEGRFEMGYAASARTAELASERALLECGRRAGWRRQMRKGGQAYGSPWSQP